MDLIDIKNRAGKLAGIDVESLCENFGIKVPDLKKSKGFVGQIAEKFLQTTVHGKLLV
jgi:DNA mismatch repair protein MutH